MNEVREGYKLIPFDFLEWRQYGWEAYQLVPRNKYKKVYELTHFSTANPDDYSLAGIVGGILDYWTIEGNYYAGEEQVPQFSLFLSVPEDYYQCNG